MPWLSVRSGKAVPRRAAVANLSIAIWTITEPADANADQWFEERTARAVSALTEQMLVQREGFTMHVLHAELRDEDEPDEADIEDGWRPRF